MKSLFLDNSSSQSKLIAYDSSVQQRGGGGVLIARCLGQVLVLGPLSRVEFALFLPLSSIHRYSHIFPVGVPCALTVE